MIFPAENLALASAPNHTVARIHFPTAKDKPERDGELRKSRRKTPQKMSRHFFRMSRAKRPGPLKVLPQPVAPSFEQLEEFWQRIRKDAAFFEEQAKKHHEATEKRCEDLEKERDDLKDKCCALEEKYNALHQSFEMAFQEARGIQDV